VLVEAGDKRVACDCKKAFSEFKDGLSSENISEKLASYTQGLEGMCDVGSADFRSCYLMAARSIQKYDPEGLLDFMTVYVSEIALMPNDFNRAKNILKGIGRIDEPEFELLLSQAPYGK